MTFVCTVRFDSIRIGSVNACVCVLLFPHSLNSMFMFNFNICAPTARADSNRAQHHSDYRQHYVFARDISDITPVRVLRMRILGIQQQPEHKRFSDISETFFSFLSLFVYILCLIRFMKNRVCLGTNFSLVFFKYFSFIFGQLNKLEHRCK